MQLLLFIHANSCDDMDEFTQWQFVLFRRRFKPRARHSYPSSCTLPTCPCPKGHWVCLLVLKKNCITSNISILVFSRKADPAAADQREELFNMNTGMYFVFLTHIWHCTVHVHPSGCLNAAPACEDSLYDRLGAHSELVWRVWCWSMSQSGFFVTWRIHVRLWGSFLMLADIPSVYFSEKINDE